MIHRIANKTYNGHGLYRGIKDDPYNPLNLPAYTIRLKYEEGVTPTFSKGTGVQVSQSLNVWDLTYNDENWIGLLYNDYDVIEILGANTTNVNNLYAMCANCSSLKNVNLFDTRNVSSMYRMFDGCINLNNIANFDTNNVVTMWWMFSNCHSLSSVPLFDTHNVNDMAGMFLNCSSLNNIQDYDVTNVSSVGWMCYSCVNVSGGSLNLYNKLSNKTEIPPHENTFRNCGVSSQTGSAELDQIPDDWK
jgi:surface protein